MDTCGQKQGIEKDFNSTNLLVYKMQSTWQRGKIENYVIFVASALLSRPKLFHLHKIKIILRYKFKCMKKEHTWWYVYPPC